MASATRGDDLGMHVFLSLHSLGSCETKKKKNENEGNLRPVVNFNAYFGSVGYFKVGMPDDEGVRDLRPRDEKESHAQAHVKLLREKERERERQVGLNITFL